MFAAAGHSVRVFAAGKRTDLLNNPTGVRIRRIPATTRTEFSTAIVPHIIEEHARMPFDVIEAPEIGPEGAAIFAALPSVARVVKLHTPTFLVQRIGWDAHPAHTRLRFWAASLVRGHWRTLGRPRYDRRQDPEYHGALLADEIAAPSRAIARVLRAEWALPAHKVHVYPYPFIPSGELLNIPEPTAIRTIGFLGRLEPRKGVLEIIQALYVIQRTAPYLRFRFIGPSWPFRGSDMQQWITQRHRSLMDHMEFAGPVDPADIPSALAQVDAVLLPSRWENFPFACWESLAAARVVIGSREGGMPEVIEDGISGLLVEPRSASAIAQAVLCIVNNLDAARRMAAAGRERITSLLRPSRVLPLQLASYERAIHMARLRQKLPT